MFTWLGDINACTRARARYVKDLDKVHTNLIYGYALLQHPDSLALYTRPKRQWYCLNPNAAHIVSMQKHVCDSVINDVPKRRWTKRRRRKNFIKIVVMSSGLTRCLARKKAEMLVLPYAGPYARPPSETHFATTWSEARPAAPTQQKH